MRAHNIDLANNNSVLKVIKNGIGIEGVTKMIQDVIDKVGTSNELISAGDTITLRFFGIIKLDPESLNDGFELNVKVPNSKGEKEDFKYIIPAI